MQIVLWADALQTDGGGSDGSLANRSRRHIMALLLRCVVTTA